MSKQPSRGPGSLPDRSSEWAPFEFLDLRGRTTRPPSCVRCARNSRQDNHLQRIFRRIRGNCERVADSGERKTMRYKFTEQLAVFEHDSCRFFLTIY